MRSFLIFFFCLIFSLSICDLHAQFSDNVTKTINQHKFIASKHAKKNVKLWISEFTDSLHLPEKIKPKPLEFRVFEDLRWEYVDSIMYHDNSREAKMKAIEYIRNNRLIVYSTEANYYNTFYESFSSICFYFDYDGNIEFAEIRIEENSYKPDKIIKRN